MPLRDFLEFFPAPPAEATAEAERAAPPAPAWVEP